MKLKTLKLLGFFIAVILTFIFHFGYDIHPNFVTSILFPVNESIAEHMKIFFGSIILSGVIQKLTVKINKLPYDNICISNFVAAIISIPIFLIIYLPTYYIFDENLIVTIILMIISIGISEYISYLIIKSKPLHLENMAIIFVIFIYTIFGLLTYFPPKIDIFKDPINNFYGIEKEQ